MVNTCPKCGSDDVDHATIGFPDAMQCLDCGYLFPQVMSLFPKLIKTNVVKTETSWPFPTSLVNKPLNDIPVKIDGLKDAQEAPF
jgi:uncharacterized Zn finger protein